MPSKFDTPYDPKATEEGIYKLWVDSGFFNPDVCVQKGVTKIDAPVYSIVLPPPNVTGKLHLGHAYEHSLQDVFVRYHRMLGDKTLWIPGTDSAAIATQSKVETLIYKEENKTRYDIGREELLKRIAAFAKESKKTIVSQVKRLGASLDWSRLAYTMDEERYGAVMEAFVQMYNANLIYRGYRIVNWDPKLKTTVSDDELEYEEEVTNFYYLKYGPFTIGTARPETKFGDKYVVMHPDDSRYKEYIHGQKFEVEWINGPITATVIKDDSIDMEFGTGVMTITPAHSFQDFEIAQKYELEYEQIIDEKGVLLPIAGEFAGEHIKKARPRIVEKLQSKELVEKIDDKYTHNIAKNSRGGGIIEPQIKLQWFVNVNREFTLPHSRIPGIPSGSTTTLKEIMRKAVESGSVKILPENYEKIYYHWIDNLNDWCISRQIWYGHRIPVWYKGEDIHVKPQAPHGAGWEQDPDTLDTWFSAGLWPLSTLGWPKETEDLKKFFPNALMAPGYEILFFWVARMILMSGFLQGSIPFKTVFIHGMVRDAAGKKFSKSLGTGIDPLDIIDRYGADALRMSLLVGAAPGSDIKFDEQRVKGYKNFANKMWNATRFVLQAREEYPSDVAPVLTPNDKTTLEALTSLLTDVTKDIEGHRINLATEKLYHYFWHTFADVIIEECKVRLRGESENDKKAASWILYEILTTLIKAIHPFMPFVTEEIWQSLPHNTQKSLLMIEPWPLQR